MTRRDAIKAAAIGVAAAAVGVSDAAQPEMQRIVDTHVHLWDLNRLRLPWIEKNSPLARSYVMKDYQTAIEGLNVVKGVYMEVDVSTKDLVAEAEFVLDVCRQANTPLV